MKTKRLSQRLIISALRFHGPMSDAKLCWLLGHCGMKPGAVRYQRKKLEEKQIARRHEEPEKNERGQWVNRWELFPKFRRGGIR